MPFLFSRGFNPCFIGNASATSEKIEKKVMEKVSILVLLEMLLQQPQKNDLFFH